MTLTADQRVAIQRRLRDRSVVRQYQELGDHLTAEHFAEQRAANNDPSRLTADLCGRRAGKSRGKNKGMLARAMRTRGGRFLVINETRNEVRRINWIGVQGDGMATVVEKEQLPAVLNASEMSVTFPEIDSIINCVGVDDEASIRRALGGAYHGVWWDEAQKIPPRFEQTIREVFMPTLLDHGGTFALTGSPSRQMAGLFYDVTRDDGKATPRGWSVHRWNMLANPHFGRAVCVDETWYARNKRGEIDGGPYDGPEPARERAKELRMRDGILDLQSLYGGPDVAPIDSPIMLREAFGRWTHEDAAYTYAFHRCEYGPLHYAPQRFRADGFPDIAKAMRDLPMVWHEQDECVLAVGADLGYYPDPFAFVIWAWHPKRATIYEVASWRQTHLDTEQQAAVLRSIRDVCEPSFWVADAGGGGRPAVAGWSREWIDRYGIPFNEATKHNKDAAIENFNADMLARTADGRPRMQLREGSPLSEELSRVQWMRVRSATGRQMEDPSIPNDTTDAGLYAHRAAWHHRIRPEAPPPPIGSDAYYAAAEKAMEHANHTQDDEDDFEPAW